MYIRGVSRLVCLRHVIHTCEACHVWGMSYILRGVSCLGHVIHTRRVMSVSLRHVIHTCASERHAYVCLRETDMHTYEACHVCLSEACIRVPQRDSHTYVCLRETDMTPHTYEACHVCLSQACHTYVCGLSL